jgi:hypothetical protein
LSFNTLQCSFPKRDIHAPCSILPTETSVCGQTVNSLQPHQWQQSAHRDIL